MSHAEMRDELRDRMPKTLLESSSTFVVMVDGTAYVLKNRMGEDLEKILARAKRVVSVSAADRSAADHEGKIQA